MKAIDVTFVVYDVDEFELPCGVFDTIEEVASFLGCSTSYVLHCILYCRVCCLKKVMVFYGLDKMDD